MNLLWESDALLAATKGRPVGEMPEGITGISIDTRSLKPGEAYFAIKGDKLDGHDFVSAAMKAGASMAIVAEEKLVALGGLKIPLVVVRDVLEAMRQLGMAARARTKAKIIAVTGSVGKTTTKEMLGTVLSASGNVHASVASFNNHWGVPLTLARMPADTRYGIFEIGMNHRDEIRPLVKMVRPHLGVVTNVEAAHLGAFKNLEEIAKAKAEIFEGIVSGGTAVINKDNDYGELLQHYAENQNIKTIVTYSIKTPADFWLKHASEVDGQTAFEVVLEGETLTGKLNLSGAHFLSNLLAVLGIAKLCGANIKKSIEAVSQISPEKGRGMRHILKKNSSKFTLIDESYNANPASMKAAIASLGKTETRGKGRRIAVLGDMLELGEFSDGLHKDIAKVLEENSIDRVYTIGEHIKVLGPELDGKIFAGNYKSWKAANNDIAKTLRSGDVIMLKASNGLRFADFVDALCKKFRIKEKR